MGIPIFQLLHKCACPRPIHTRYFRVSINCSQRFCLRQMLATPRANVKHMSQAQRRTNKMKNWWKAQNENESEKQNMWNSNGEICVGWREKYVCRSLKKKKKTRKEKVSKSKKTQSMFHFWLILHTNDLAATIKWQIFHIAEMFACGANENRSYAPFAHSTQHAPPIAVW